MTEEHKLQLNEEKTVIKRSLFQSQEISWHKETVTEPRTVTVEVRREELVIERRYFSPDLPHHIVKTECIRIPLREERFDICKKPFTLEEVRIYKIRQQHLHPVKTLTKKEVVAVKTDGDQTITIQES